MLSGRSGSESSLRDKTAVLAQWAHMIADIAQVEPLPLRLCLGCVRLADADGGAITLAYTRTERVTLCATDETAARLEDLQDVLGQGTGPDAYRTGQTVTASLDSPAAVSPESGSSCEPAEGSAAEQALERALAVMVTGSRG